MPADGTDEGPGRSDALPAAMWEQLLDSKEPGPQAFLDFISQRLAKRQRELDSAVKFSSHYVQVESILVELKAVRTKFLTLMRREGLL